MRTALSGTAAVLWLRAGPRPPFAAAGRVVAMSADTHGVVCASARLGTIAISCVETTSRTPPFDTQGDLLQRAAANVV